MQMRQASIAKKHLMRKGVSVIQVLVTHIDNNNNNNNEKSVYMPKDIICYVLCPNYIIPLFSSSKQFMSLLCPCYVLTGGIL